MGHAVGEGLQLLVAGAQLAGQLGHFLGFAQDDTEHRIAQLQRALDHHLIPGLRIAAQGFLPLFEAVSRSERTALTVDLFFRLTGPVDGLDLLVAKPDQIVRVQARDGDGHDPGTALGERRHAGDVAADAVTVEDQLVAPFAQPLRQLQDLFMLRRVADGFALVGGDDRRAVGTGEPQHHLGEMAETLDHAVAIGHRREQVDDLVAQFQLALREGLAFPRLDLQREDAAEQLAGGAGLVADRTRFGIMAGDQPPEAVANDDGDRHRRQRAHVAHVLQMHRGNAAQCGEAQVQWRAGDRIERRHQWRGLIVGILDHPDQVLAIQPARLLRNVGGREAQPEVAWIAGVGDLCQHHAVVFGIEAIGFDAAEAGDALDLPNRQLAERFELAAVLQLGDEGAHQRVEGVVGLARGFRAFEFEDQLAAMAMAEQGERLAGDTSETDAHIAQVKGVVVVFAQCRETGFEACGGQQVRQWLTE